MKEIGSEFHFSSITKVNELILPKLMDDVLTFSGRTAIETVLINEPQIKRVLLPSYCCDSMIEPFRKRNIEISFFSVNYDEKLKIDIPYKNVDAVLLCNYFGFNIDFPDLSQFINKGVIIIEDITHSFYSITQFHKYSNYLIASLRKWGPLISGGYCGSRYKPMIYKPIYPPPLDFILEKCAAMKMKRDYLNGKNINKDNFLKLFSKSNEWLALNYSCRIIDEESANYLKRISILDEIEARRRNAKVLYGGLKENDQIKFLFSEDTMDCPLFIPIIIANGNRDVIRQRLIDNHIYCPTHWPKPNAECQSNLYDLELSLICDQRYDEDDMQKIINIICNI